MDPLEEPVGRTFSLQPPEQMKGAPLSLVLRGGGHCFSNVDDLRDRDLFSHARSRSMLCRAEIQRCRKYDAFVSHDWRASRWLKYLSLLVLYNSEAAAKSTFLVSLLLGVLIACQIIPRLPGAFMINYLFFAIIFLFWQNIRGLFLKPKLLFVDKLVIPQNDEEVKQQCIMALGAYLTSSEELVILWSEGYFSRLWCVFELNFFLRKHDLGKNVQVMPVVLPVLMLMHTAWWFFLRLGFEFLWEIWTDSVSRAIVSISFSLIGFCITFPLQSRFGEQLVEYLGLLPLQLQKFDIRRAKCSCCSVNHRHPKSLQRIPCDRELICKAVTRAYGRDDDPEEERLEKFNETVRNQLAHRILDSWGSKVVPLRLYIYMVFSMQTSLLTKRIVSMADRMPQSPSAMKVTIVVGQDILHWMITFPVLLLFLWCSMRIWKSSGKFKHPTCPILWTFSQGLLLVLSCLVMWLFQSWPFYFFSGTPVVLGAVLPISISFAVALYLLKKEDLTPSAEAMLRRLDQPGDLSPMPSEIPNPSGSSDQPSDAETSFQEDPMVEVKF
eukprot:s1082_g8.t1